MQKQISNRLAWLLISIFLGGGGTLIALSLYFYRSSIVVFLSLFLGYLFHGLTFSLLMLVLSYLGLKQTLKNTSQTLNSISNSTSITVAVPVFNEEEVIISCIDSILKQSRKPYEIIIINDESTDKTLEKLITTYQLKVLSLRSTSKIETTKTINVYESTLIPSLKVIDKKHKGKADALNAALNISQGEIFVTIDADSFLHQNAIERLVAALETDQLVVGAGGTVKAGNGVSAEILASDKGHLPKGFLPKIQWIEYATGFVWRFGWGFINTLLLISGSFGAFRTDILRKCQGFDPNSITEDYEMVYRIHQYHLSKKIAYKLVTVPDALIYTLVPTTVLALIKQRIRWFQGFLQTLFRYRSLVFRTSYGVLGIFMLPIKCIDALSPLWSLVTYTILVHQLIYQTFPISFELLFGMVSLRWLIDILMTWILLGLHYKFMVAPLPLKQRLLLCLISPFYLITSQLIWYVYGIAAYYRSAKGVKRWDKLERRGFQQLQQSEDMSLP
jgi:cellulose synthase/poly-beta-1,6-N-acetylglucosamine synthase-like glycosyltransferase